MSYSFIVLDMNEIFLILPSNILYKLPTNDIHLTNVKFKIPKDLKYINL